MKKDRLPADRVAIVVGAAGELGRATVLKLADRGMSVVAVDRNEPGLEGLPDGVAREAVDATDPAAAAPMVERIAHDVGPPDALVNTIGAFQTGDALTTTPDLLHLMMDINLGPALWLSQAVAPYMQRNGSGSIVHIAARPGIEPSAGTVAYSASKAALVHLTRILDVELRPLGIRVNSVAPQLLDTARARAAFPKEALAHAVAPEAIAEVVAFLVSEAAAPVSGAILPAYGA
ncbi:MAG: SDR family oxidoreductase [Acidimicrobiales bacterium]|jgi:NAD(P)-dependent dehydrogenase (short-subunit alcohol dehydrogenase family)